MIQSNYFLPFTPNGQQTELTAIKVKQALRLGAYASVDPFTVLERIPARLLTIDDFRGCSPATLRVLFGPLGDMVSAIGYGRSPATGEWLIRVNESHHIHRQRASLMEEIVHIILDHPQTLLTPGTRAAKSRTYDKAVEDEAYNVGAACIIPYRELFYAIKDRHETADLIADRHDVSLDYVQFRIKRAGLSKMYSKYCR